MKVSVFSLLIFVIFDCFFISYVFIVHFKKHSELNLINASTLKKRQKLLASETYSSLWDVVSNYNEDFGDWEQGNYLLNSIKWMPSETSSSNQIPKRWTLIGPNKSFSPRLRILSKNQNRNAHDLLSKSTFEKNFLMMKGSGYVETFGYLKQKVKIPNNWKWYLLRTRFKVEGIFENFEKNIMHMVVINEKPKNMVSYFYEQNENNWIRGSVLFQPKSFFQEEKNEDIEIEIRLYFKSSAHGSVIWDRLSLIESSKDELKQVRIATVSGTGDFNWWSKVLDLVGTQGCDIAILPEFMNQKDPSGAELIDTGPTFQLLSQKAKEWKMYITTTIYEVAKHKKSGSLCIYKSSPLYDRFGNLAGLQRHVELEQLELDFGLSNGEEITTIRTDFGNIAILTESELWLSNILKILSLKKIDFVFIPNIDILPSLLSIRALESGVFLISASQKNFETTGVYDEEKITRTLSAKNMREKWIDLNFKITFSFENSKHKFKITTLTSK